MRQTQLEATAWECVAGLTLMLGVWVWIVAHSGYLVGIPVTCVTFGLLYLMIAEGRKAFNEFDLQKDWNGEHFSFALSSYGHSQRSFSLFLCMWWYWGGGSVWDRVLSGVERE